ncbi:MAG: XisI protein [Limnospira sp. PMC 1291.21]|uniref:FdxN element excision controlling factor protein, XisL-like n=3 Tax=Limnospira TaxID=2596745 RepID=A0A9P1KA01_9CYAN|nr:MULTISPECIES: XisI protein [Limnospira]MDC0838096.1 XisI protein [Limnoraphis robusta]QJB28845.1 XisI protein [Limnospira fusiformis SAG 85.79]RAQ40781.1 XisI protein [Arthrospira sp. O9.13F]UWU51532.1 XisI protein [Arthrospira platensis C1]EDZ92877.1 XisI protein [Limnospira maxima CS-328]
MDKLNKYHPIICEVMKPYARINYANIPVKNRAAFDGENGQYLILSEGWIEQQHFHSCLLHVEIIDDRVWIQWDQTEDGIADELVQAGIPKEDIILGFHEPEVRQYTGFGIPSVSCQN